MKMKFLRTTVFPLLIVVMLGLAGCSGGANPATSAPAATQPPSNENLPAVRSNSSVIAEGKVVPAEDAALSFSTAGVVDEVLVKETDKIEKDQTIIRLKGNEKIESAVAGAELELLTAQNAVRDLKDTADLARASIEMELATANRELDLAEKRINWKDYTRGDQEQIDIARANLVIAEDAVSDAEELYDKFDDRSQDDPMRAEVFSQLAAARQRRDKSQANLDYLLKKPDDLDVGEIDAKLSVAKAKVADAQRKLELMKDGPDKNQLALAEERVKNAEVALKAAKASLDDLELKAPFAATISAIDVTEGEAISPNVPVVTVADFSTWNVETTDLTELNIARIKMGQPAIVRFDAVPGLDIIGRVSSIKPFGENRQGDVVYTVVLKLEVPDERLRWNMTASVTFLEKESDIQ